VPWIPRYADARADATVIQLGPDPIHHRLPFRGFRSDIAVAGDAGIAYVLLREALRGKLKNRAAAVDARRKRIKAMREEIDRGIAKLLDEAKDMRPIHPAWLAHCINKVKNDDAIIINELGVPFDHLAIDKPNCFLPGGGAGGLGRGLGEALGAKLAAPGRQVMALVGDGSYMFCVPTAAHYVGLAERLPTLTIVSNNAMWFAVRGATLGMYPQGRASKANTMPLTDLAPSPAFEKTIEACGGVGERIEDPAKLTGAIERALKHVDGGTSALLNVICRARG